MILRELKIAGMTCNHCVMAVKRELARLPAVRIKEVAIGSASIEFDETSITEGQIRAAVEAAGYPITKEGSP